MAHRHHKSAPPPKTDTRGLDLILLSVCLGLICLRCLVIESPVSRQSMLTTNLYDLTYSLTLSLLMLGALTLWFVCVCRRHRFVYRPCGVEFGLIILASAGLVSMVFASDKRAAISDLIIFCAPILLALLLVQLLNNHAKIRLVLALIAVLGVVCTFESFDQYFVSNQTAIEAYEESPNQFLEPLGLREGTLEHFLFEHRLYSKGVNGFFTTRNSNGMFLLMAALASLALAAEGRTIHRRERRDDRRTDRTRLTYSMTALIIAVINTAGLILTQSKGAIGGFLLAVLGMGLLYRCYTLMQRHIKLVVAIGVLLCLIFAGCFIAYGLTAESLPGGNSMLVRWQYWTATGDMIAEHPWLGVGPGNFPQAYHQYKPAAAPESVADPHNAVLSLWCQYGVLGLLGFVLMLIPLFGRVTVADRPVDASTNPKEHTELADKRLYWCLTFAICTILLAVKPVAGLLNGDPPLVILLTNLVHILLLCVGMIVLLGTSAGAHTSRYPSGLSTAGPVLFFCVLGVLAASMIDFALFEPGVLTCFWAIAACLLALGQCHRTETHHVTPLPSLAGSSMPMIMIGLFGIVFGLAWLPVLRCTLSLRRANMLIEQGRPEQAHRFFIQAAQQDRLSDGAFYRNGRLYLYQYEQSPDPTLLENAKACFIKATKRNPVNYQSYEKLLDTCTQLNQTEQAYQAAQQALTHYPACGRLWFKLAGVCEQLGKNDQAINAYKHSVMIENQFLDQFQRMYPEVTKPPSRLGQENYEAAQQRLQALNAKKNESDA